MRPITLKRALIKVLSMFGRLPGAFSKEENQGHEWDTYVKLNVHHVRKAGWPTSREAHGHGVPIVVDGVTPIQGDGKYRLQGEVGQVEDLYRINEAVEMTKAQRYLEMERNLRNSIGEPCFWETRTQGSEGGSWKSAACQ
jgi:hypothetical protein